MSEIAGQGAMPADFPRWGRVYAFFRRWRRPLRRLSPTPDASLLQRGTNSI
ncbi:hypothetical protein [Streptomyces sp. NPDC058086]|uniref:hypothetical protein n=1 Tax=Streptomyces sp. NPDC058086 TaxID=3346334 RepID=UPI0036EFFE62